MAKATFPRSLPYVEETSHLLGGLSQSITLPAIKTSNRPKFSGGARAAQFFLFLVHNLGVSTLHFFCWKGGRRLSLAADTPTAQNLHVKGKNAREMKNKGENAWEPRASLQPWCATASPAPARVWEQMAGKGSRWSSLLRRFPLERDRGRRKTRVQLHGGAEGLVLRLDKGWWRRIARALLPGCSGRHRASWRHRDLSLSREKTLRAVLDFNPHLTATSEWLQAASGGANQAPCLGWRRKRSSGSGPWGRGCSAPCALLGVLVLSPPRGDIQQSRRPADRRGSAHPALPPG